MILIGRGLDQKEQVKEKKTKSKKLEIIREFKKIEELEIHYIALSV